MKTENFGASSWTDNDLRWYHDDEEFVRKPWWEVSWGNGQSKRGSFDGQNSQLAYRSSKGKTHLHPEPLMWEILRRHPHIPQIRERFGVIFDREIVDGQELQSAFEQFRQRWSRHGASCLSAILKLGKRPWPYLSFFDRHHFAVALPNFFKDPQNLPMGKRLAFAGLPKDSLRQFPRVASWIREIAGLKLPEDLSEISIADLEKRIAAKGLLFLPLTVDPKMTKERIREEVIRHVDVALSSASDPDIPDEKTISSEGMGSQKRRNTFNLTQKKYLTLGRLDLSAPLSTDERKNAKAMFGDFFLL